MSSRTPSAARWSSRPRVLALPQLRPADARRRSCARTVEARGENYLTFPQRALFDRIGMRAMVLETDPWGNFIMTGFDYGTAARLGALRAAAPLERRLAAGRRAVLPRLGRVHAPMPAPAAPDREYGGQFWLNAGGAAARPARRLLGPGRARPGRRSSPRATPSSCAWATAPRHQQHVRRLLGRDGRRDLAAIRTG